MMQKKLAIAQSQLLLIQAAKEYEADWLKNASTVLRDEYGRFTQKDGNFIEKSKSLYQEDVKRHNHEFAKKQFVESINSIPDYLAKATDYVFGGDYRQKMNKLAQGLGDLGIEMRAAATRKYKDFEPRIKSMTSEEFEQALQDELINLNLVNDRTLIEDLKEAKDVKDVKNTINKHQAEIIASAVAVGRGAAVVAGAFAPWFLASLGGELLVSGLFGSAMPTLWTLFEQSAISFGVGEITKAGANLLIDKNIKDKKLKNQYKEWAELGTDIFGLIAGKRIIEVIEAGKNKKVWEKAIETTRQVLKENSELMLKKEKESLLALGLDSYPSTVDELEKAYRVAAENVAGKQLSLEKELTEINRLSEIFNFIKKQMME